MARNSHDTRQPRDHDPSDGPESTRRQLVGDALRGAAKVLGVVGTVKGSTDLGRTLLHEGAQRRRVYIPPRFRRPLRVTPGTEITSYGDSYANAYGGNGAPMGHRTGTKLRDRGIDVYDDNAAVNGSSVDDLPGQAGRRKKTGRKQLPIVWSGHNDLADGDDARELTLKMQGGFLDKVEAGMEYPITRNRLLDRFEGKYERGTRGMLNETGAGDVELILPAPIQWSQEVQKVDPMTGDISERVRLRGDPTRQDLVADIIYGAGERVVRVAEKLEADGYTVGITDPRDSITPEVFRGRKDMHMNESGYDTEARAIARGRLRGPLE